MAATAFTYPATRFAPAKLVDINSPAERARLSGPGLRAFFKIVKQWELTDDKAKALLGGVTNGPFYEMKKNGRRSLDPDTLTRLSYLIGIYKALHILYGRDLANEWISLANANAISGGSSPVEYMIRGGIPAMQIVRRLLDARRGR